MSAATMNEMERLRRERDEAFDKGRQVFEDLRRVEAERDALAAHVGRLSEALRKIDADLEGRNFLENSSLRDTARAAIEVLPATSLARLKAKWQAEAYLAGWKASCEGWNDEHPGDAHENDLWIDERDEWLRRQAEESTNGHH